MTSGEVLLCSLWLAPPGLMMMFLSPVGGRLSNKRGPKFTLVLGVSILALGYVVGVVGMGTTWGILATGLVINSGVALAYGAMPSIVMSSVPRSETASANGFNTLMRSLGTTIGAAVIGLVLAQMTIPLGGVDVPSETGFRTALLIGAGVSVVAAIIAAFIPAAKAKLAEPALEKELVSAGK